MKTTIGKLREVYNPPINWSGSRSLHWPEPDWRRLGVKDTVSVTRQDVFDAFGFYPWVSTLLAFDDSEAIAQRFAAWCAIRSSVFVQDSIFKEIAQQTQKYLDGRISLKDFDRLPVLSRARLLENAEKYHPDNQKRRGYLAAEYAVLWAQIASFQTGDILQSSVNSVYYESLTAHDLLSTTGRQFRKDAEQYLTDLIREIES